MSPAFWGILVALPLGKLIGITAGAAAMGALSALGRPGERPMPLGDVVAVAAVAGLGGMGFTVSLLMNELAWGDRELIANEGTPAVLAASVVAAVIGVVLTRGRAR